MAEMIKNGILVENEFTYLSHKFTKGQLLIAVDINTLLLEQKNEKGELFTTPISLNAWSDPIRYDFYNVVRFIFDNGKNLSIVRFKKR